MTNDPDSARRFFAEAYNPQWRLAGLEPGTSVQHLRSRAGQVSLDEVTVGGRGHLLVHPVRNVVIISPCRGRLSQAGDWGPIPAISGEPLMVTPDLPCGLLLDHARFHIVSIEQSALRRVAADLPMPIPDRIRFLGCRVATATSAASWHRTLDFAETTFAAEDAVPHSPTVMAAAHALAAATLECFPSNLAGPASADNDGATPAALSRALSFVQDHADSDIGVNDIAAAVHLTPRAVQYLFRRRLDTTPTEYVRSVRLIAPIRTSCRQPLHHDGQCRSRPLGFRPYRPVRGALPPDLRTESAHHPARVTTQVRTCLSGPRPGGCSGPGKSR